MVDTRVSGVVREALVTDSSSLRLGAAAREALVTDSSSLRLGAAAREALVSGLVATQLAGMAREVLRTSDFFAGQIHLRLFRASEIDSGDEEIWYPSRHRSIIISAIIKKIRSYLWISS